MKSIRMGVVAALILAVGVVVPASPAAASTGPIDLGVATHSTSVINTLALPNSKLLVFSTTSAKTGAMRVALVDAVTGKKDAEYQLANTPNGTGHSGSWASTIAADGKVYFGTIATAGLSARLFSFDPSAPAQPLDLGVPVVGESYVFSLTPGVNASGQMGVYGGTYPHGNFFFRNLVTGVTTNYGQPAPGVSYIRGMATAPNGLIYVGTGTPARAFVFNPATSAWLTELSLPAGYSGYSFGYTVTSIGAKMAINLVQNSGPDATVIYDPANVNAAGVVAPTNITTRVVTNPSDPNRVYSQDTNTNEMVDYNVATNTKTVLGPPAPKLIMGQLALVAANGKISAISASGDLWTYNLSNSQWNTTLINDGVSPTPLTSDGMAIDSLQYLNGKVYGGAYLNQMLFSYDVSTGTFKDEGYPISNGGEILSMASLNGKLYMGSYTEAVISVYDPSQPWNPGTAATSNPRRLGNLGLPQYRPYGMTVGLSDGMIYIGSDAGYGASGGAISMLNPATNSITELYRFTSGGVSAIAAAGGKVYAGMTDGRFYVYDVASDTISPAFDGGSTAITSVRLAPNGYVYVTNASGVVKAYGASLGFTFSAQAVTGPIRGSIIGNDGNLYMVGLNSLVKLQISNNSLSTVANQGNGPEDGFSWYNTITLDPATGTIYYGAGERLKAFTP